MEIKMNKLKAIVTVAALTLSTSVMAFTSDNERIDAYLKVLDSTNMEKKEKMLNNLQWSGLSDARLYDDIEMRLKSQYLNPNLYGQLNLVAYQVRALGFSGNEKYRSTITEISNNAASPKLKRHARKALVSLKKYVEWNKLINNSHLNVDGESVEVATYMKMLTIDDVLLQRIAARAIFHEKQHDNDLLDLAAVKLKELYLQPGLSGAWQDTASWLCKAIGQSGDSQYINLLSIVASDTPHQKIKRYASKYI